MLSVARSTARAPAAVLRRSPGYLLIRLASTESSSPANTTTPPPPSTGAATTSTPRQSSPSSSPSLSRPHPAPRSTSSPQPHYSQTHNTPQTQFYYSSKFAYNRDSTFKSVLTHLPTNFGRNQRLPVPDETRALLEEIVGQFNAPIRYAFAYGSGVFAQDGYSKSGPKPMIDFLFAVSHPDHWHSINLSQYPSHYPLHARVLGSSIISRVQDIRPGVWFNAYVPMSGVQIKYGVTTVDNLCSDLLTWNSLYLSGRMHKPIRIIKDDPRVRLTQQVNLASAVRTALLMLPEKFEEDRLFETLAGFSYGGDPRMALPAENRMKVQNIVKKQQPQFRELYQRLVNGLPGVHWAPGSSQIEQDVGARGRSLHLRKLPVTLLKGVEHHYMGQTPALAQLKEADDGQFWLKVAGCDKLGGVIQQEMRSIVRGPATIQTAKGIFTAGVTKSVKYGLGKVGKWWQG